MKKSKRSIAKILSFEPNEAELRTELSCETMDWEWFVKATSQLGVMTSSYCRLEQKELLDLLPDDLNTYLRGIAKINRNRNQALLQQVKEISELFNTNSINHVFIKGCALMASGYFKDYAERLIGDIDLLVEPTDLYKAEQLLLNLNYVASKTTLFGKYKKHRHLPRLVHPDRLGAVEIHSKLLRKNKPKILNPEEILAQKIILNNVYVPRTESNIDLLILNEQVNDFGYVFKTVSFKGCYDSLVLEHQKEQWINETTSKYHRLFYNLRALYFEPNTWGSTNTTTPFWKSFYKPINQNRVVRQVYSRFIKITLGIITCFEGMTLFVKNKNFRADVWTHKLEVLKLLRGE